MSQPSSISQASTQSSPLGSVQLSPEQIAAIAEAPSLKKDSNHKPSKAAAAAKPAQAKPVKQEASPIILYTLAFLSLVAGMLTTLVVANYVRLQ